MKTLFFGAVVHILFQSLIPLFQLHSTCPLYQKVVEGMYYHH